jgi:hypothetical protein
MIELPENLTLSAKDAQWINQNIIYIIAAQHGQIQAMQQQISTLEYKLNILDQMIEDHGLGIDDMNTAKAKVDETVS